ncbi:MULTISPECIES: hypothetical protein [Streptomyces]|nr:hypothetical protein [Streptomyces yerevanensis]
MLTTSATTMKTAMMTVSQVRMRARRRYMALTGQACGGAYAQGAPGIWAG